MGFKTWSVGEEVLASDFNQYVGSQIVARFTDSSQRATQLPGPEKGQLSTLDTHTGVLFVYTGAEWQPAAPFIQSGETVVTTNAGGGATILYPTAFAVPPGAVHFTDQDASTPPLQFGVIMAQKLVDAIGFTVWHYDGSPHLSAPARVGWTAIGIRAAD